jgi:hypothetical protein
MEVVFLTDLLKNRWNAFCENQEEGWFWHTTYWMEYCVNSRFETNSENISFLITDKDRIHAIVPLIIEENCFNNENIREFTFSGGPTPYFIIDKSLDKSIKEAVEILIWNEIDRILAEKRIVRIYLRSSCQNSNYISNQKTLNPFIKMGFLDTSMYSCILSLDIDEKALLSNMRKGHSSAVKKSLKFLNIECYDENNVTKDKVIQFRDTYFKVAGKVTRPESTFNMIYDFIKRSMGLLFEARLNDEVVGYSLVFYYKNYGYYAMACVIPDYKDYNVSHFLQWHTFLRLKNQEVSYYELGEQYFADDIFSQTSDKMKSISSFKRGFGGEFVLQFSGESFYEKDYFIALLSKRIENYALNRWK